MSTVDRFALVGPAYHVPRFRVGDVVQCSVRGEVTIVGISDGKMAWPVGKTHRAKSLVVYKDLERAIRTESNLAVCHWWGITSQTVTKWRNAIGVGPLTEGTSQLRAAYGAVPELAAKRAEGLREADLTERNRKLAEARRGKPRPKWLRKHLRAVNLGRTTSEATKAKQSQTHRRLGTRPNNGTRLWTAEEDRLVIELEPKEAAEKCGRTLKAIYSRRVRLAISMRSEKTNVATAGR